MTFGEWELLAKQGIAEAEYNLGLMFSRGKEVPRDDKKAVKWYRLAAEQGLAQSQTNLGLMFGKGQGVEQGLPGSDQVVQTIGRTRICSGPIQSWVDV